MHTRKRNAEGKKEKQQDGWMEATRNKKMDGCKEKESEKHMYGGRKMIKKEIGIGAIHEG